MLLTIFFSQNDKYGSKSNLAKCVYTVNVPFGRFIKMGQIPFSQVGFSISSSDTEDETPANILTALLTRYDVTVVQGCLLTRRKASTGTVYFQQYDRSSTEIKNGKCFSEEHVDVLEMFYICVILDVINRWGEMHVVLLGG